MLRTVRPPLRNLADCDTPCCCSCCGDSPWPACRGCSCCGRSCIAATAPSAVAAAALLLVDDAFASGCCCWCWCWCWCCPPGGVAAPSLTCTRGLARVAVAVPGDADDGVEVADVVVVAVVVLLLLMLAGAEVDDDDDDNDAAAADEDAVCAAALGVVPPV